jgi:hypothetical protein
MVPLLTSQATSCLDVSGGGRSLAPGGPNKHAPAEINGTSHTPAREEKAPLEGKREDQPGYSTRAVSGETCEPGPPDGAIVVENVKRHHYEAQVSAVGRSVR